MERIELARLLESKEQAAGSTAPVVISEPDPRKFMAMFAAAVGSQQEVFLGDPHWGSREKSALASLLDSKNEKPASNSNEGWLMIPTGGTGGRLKFARHDQRTMAAAVNGFARHFRLTKINAVGVLPLHHVSGLMAWMRCALTGGEFRPLDWKALEQGELPQLPEKPDGWLISLVPTQLERLMQQPRTTTWLAKFRLVLLGGAPASSGLLDRAAAARIPLALGYGMTETAAMVSALRPTQFLLGARSCGSTLPHAQVSITFEGLIRVAGRSVFRGYYPAWQEDEVMDTSDLGRLDEQGQLHVSGRSDDIIITGGEKIHPAEIEAVLRDTGEFTEVVVVGLPSQEWGQVVVAVHPAEPAPNLAKVAAELAMRLSPAKRPKQFVGISVWPVSSQDKINRAEVARLAASQLG